MATTKTRARNRAILEAKKTYEPDCNQQEGLGNALNWYSANTGPKDQKKYTLDYYKKVDKTVHDQLKVLEDWNFMTFGSLCRLRTREMWDPEQSTSTFYARRLEELLTRAATKMNAQAEADAAEAAKPKAKVYSIQERMDMKARELAGEVEGAIDDYLRDGTEFDCKNWLKLEEVSPQVAKRIGEFYIPVRDEIVELIEGKCEQLNEGYAHMKRRERKKYLAFLQGIIDACDQQVQTAKVQRAPRKRKVQSPAQQTKHVKYMREFAELKLKSVTPDKIIGSKELWVYNTKNRRLTVYRAEMDLMVKGTSVIGFDLSKSTSQTLRKPEDFFKGLTMTKRPLNAAIKDLKTKASVPNGRINADCILLGAF